MKENNEEDELKKINRRNKEFYYLEDLVDVELKEVETSKKIYIDQGKCRLIYALNDDNGKFMAYSGKERGFHLKTNQHIFNTKKLMEQSQINDINEKLKDLNRKTSLKEEIKENQKKWNDENEKVYHKYLNNKFLKNDLQKYINKQKTEACIIKKIMTQLDISDVKSLNEYILIIGDWKGSNNLINSKSTLGIGMKRLLRKYFKKCI